MEESADKLDSLCAVDVTSVAPASSDLMDDEKLTCSSVQLSPQSALSCEMCQNYEINLTIMQDTDRRLKEELKAQKGLSDRYESELLNERQYRSDLEKKMGELAVQTEDSLKEAFKLNSHLEKSLESLTAHHKSSLDSSAAKMKEQTDICSGLEEELHRNAEKYMTLLGRNRKTAAEMRTEPIDLPTDVDQLQFMCLQMREELIELKSARQHTEDELSDQVTLIREQLDEERRMRSAMERDLLEQVNNLHTQLGISNSQLSSAGNAVALSGEHIRQIRDLQHTVAELEEQVKQVQHERAAVEMTAQNYKSRCFSLQNELDTSEAVQKDFVKLSQSLQIQLEKIRQSEQEVRWQWEDDVDKCNGCELSIVKMKPKPRCHHCGKLFCSKCVRNTVPSGPNRRPAPVCEVCHTLLNRDSKPFFAQDPSS